MIKWRLKTGFKPYKCYPIQLLKYNASYKKIAENGIQKNPDIKLEAGSSTCRIKLYLVPLRLK
jgi:hypothetical protein